MSIQLIASIIETRKMKVLVIYSHSYPEQSVSGKAILEVLKAQPNVEVRNVDELYPDATPIDIAKEQASLVEADVIVFQHPVFWFGVPAGLKRWMDNVLHYGFAFGTGGDKLHGKKFVHSLTAGGAPEVYQNADFASALTLPIKCLAMYCGMDYVGAFPIYGQSAMSNPNAGELAQKHIQSVLERIAQL